MSKDKIHTNPSMIKLIKAIHNDRAKAHSELLAKLSAEWIERNKEYTGCKRVSP